MTLFRVSFLQALPKVYFSQEKPKMKGILPFQPQALMVLKFLNFAQQVALIKKPVQTFSILAFQTNICELIESYVKNQLGAKIEGPLLFLALLVRNILQKVFQQLTFERQLLSRNMTDTSQVTLKESTKLTQKYCLYI